MLSDAQGRSMKAEAGRKLVLSKYTYEHNANDFLQIYQSILNNHSKSS